MTTSAELADLVRIPEAAADPAAAGGGAAGACARDCDCDEVGMSADDDGWASSAFTGEFASGLTSGLAVGFGVVRRS